MISNRRLLLPALATATVLAATTLSAPTALAQRVFSEDESRYLFNEFTAAFKKDYDDVDDFLHRYQVFKDNLAFIERHNSQPDVSFVMEMNEFGDLTWDEFKKGNTGLKHRASPFRQALNAHVVDDTDIPRSVDWRDKGAVTKVKNQGSCGACWAFSTTGAIEGAHAIKTGKLVSLSEQELVDCAGKYGNYGCNGGLMDDAFEYVIANGLCEESDYSYKGADGQCRNCTEAVTVKGYKDIPVGSEAALMHAVGTIGPVSVAIEADQMAFQFYKKGVFDAPCGDKLDHGVLVVGYGTDEDTDKDFWIVKNSWGPTWGEEGYIKVERHRDLCGIAMSASYPVV